MQHRFEDLRPSPSLSCTASSHVTPCGCALNVNGSTTPAGRCRAAVATDGTPTVVVGSSVTVMVALPLEYDRAVEVEVEVEMEVGGGEEVGGGKGGASEFIVDGD